MHSCLNNRNTHSTSKGHTILIFFQKNKETNSSLSTCQLVFVHFLEESEDTKKTFQNQLTFSKAKIILECNLSLF